MFAFGLILALLLLLLSGFGAIVERYLSHCESKRCISARAMPLSMHERGLELVEYYGYSSSACFCVRCVNVMLELKARRELVLEMKSEAE
jgi:hypothetical protein